MGVLRAEIGQEHKLNGFEFVFPYRVGEWETVVAWITPGPADGETTLPQ